MLIKSLMLVVFSIFMMMISLVMLVMFQWRLEQGINIRANKLLIVELMCRQVLLQDGLQDDWRLLVVVLVVVVVGDPVVNVDV